MDMGGESSDFFELERPPRLVRREATGAVFELTTHGWRPAPWLRRQLEGRVPESVRHELSRRCRQRLNQRFTSDGPSLIEVNARGEFRILQHATQRGLIDEQFRRAVKL